MRRLTRSFLSLLAILVLLAGAFVPAAPARAQEPPAHEPPCGEGEFLREVRPDTGGDPIEVECVPFPGVFRVDGYTSTSWTAEIYFYGGTYQFIAWTDLDFYIKPTLYIDGAPVQFTGQGLPPQTSWLAEVELDQGFHTISVGASNTFWNYRDFNFSWGPVGGCQAGMYKVEFFYDQSQYFGAFTVCSPELSVRTRVWMEDYSVKITGEIHLERWVPLVIFHEGVKSVTTDNYNVTIERGENLLLIQSTASTDARITIVAEPPALLQVHSCAPGLWQSLYWKNPSQNGLPAYVACEARPEYVWKATQKGPWAGDPSPPAEGWSAAWVNTTDFANGTYDFHVEADQEDVDLRVKGSILLDKPGSASTNLNGLTSVRFDYAYNPPSDGGGGGPTPDRIAKVWWERSDSGARSPRCPAGTTLAEYFAQSPQVTWPDFATCETANVDWGLNAPPLWENLDQYHVRWAEEHNLPAGIYRFGAHINDGNAVEVQLNGHPVLNETGSTDKEYEYHLEQRPYRLEARYTGDGSETTVPITWEWVGGLEECPADTFIVSYYTPDGQGGDKLAYGTCQRLSLPSPESPDPPPEGNYSKVIWEGQITFPKAGYFIHGPDAGLRLTLSDGAGTEFVLDRWDQADPEPEPELWELDGEYTLRLEYRIAPDQPLPRVWWTPTGSSPRLVSATITGEKTIRLTFDQELRPAPAGAEDAFFVYYVSNDASIPIEEVTVDGRVVHLRHDMSVLDQSVRLSYFPAPEEIALVEATTAPLGIDLAFNRPVQGGSGQNTTPVSGITGPLGEGVERDALLLSSSSRTWQVDLEGEHVVAEVWLRFTQLPSSGKLTVSTSTDGSAWTDEGSLNLQELQGRETASVKVRSALVRYVKMAYDGSQTVGIDRVWVNRGTAANSVAKFILPVVITRDTKAPSLDKRIDGTEKVELNVDLIVLTYDEKLDTGSVPEPTDYTVIVDGQEYTPKSVVVQENTVTLYLPVSVKFGQAVKLSYTPGAHPVRDLSGNEAAKLTDQYVDPISVEMVNLALYGSPEATQSSTYADSGDYAAGNAIDGSRATVSRTRTEDRPWWQIDFGALSTLFDLKLFVPASVRSQPPGYLVLLSDDGESWSSAYLHPGTAIDENGLTVDLKGRKAQYLRITAPEVTELFFEEIEIWGFPPRF